MMELPIPVIDLFAGPGGLGEGFSALGKEEKKRKFKIALSIEKDEFAHETLELRAFFREFDFGEVPDEYYQYVRGAISREALFAKYPEKAEAAKREAWCTTLGKEPEENIDRKIREGLKGTKNWILIGGPPCQAYSLVGRARNRGIDPDDPKVFLYREYYRILAVHNPPVFVMENVKGLLSSKLGEDMIFQQILNDLENPVAAYKKLKGAKKMKFECPGYWIYSLVRPERSDETLFGKEERPYFKPEDFVIKAEDYGIPQARHRIILLGIRKDIKVKPGGLIKEDAIHLKKVLEGLPRLRSGLSKRKINLITQEDSYEIWKGIIEEFVSNGIMKKLDEDTRQKAALSFSSVTNPRKNKGAEYMDYDVDIEYRKDWYLDENLRGVCNHATRSHIREDIHRYFFAACFAKVHRRSPKLQDFPQKLLPKHKNVSEALSEGKFSDRFKVQLADKPATTITAHISKDGHYYIHPDPTQCRSLTVREAARIQTFPDNYFFCGPRTSQYIQVGNAVPPLLANKIAQIVFDALKQINK